MEPSSSTQNMQKIMIFAGIGFLVLILVLFTVMSQVSKARQQATVAPSPTPESVQPEFTGQGTTSTGSNGSGVSPAKAKPTAPVAGVIAKVGDEYIYNADLNLEISSLPPSEDPEQRTQIFNKMMEDSIILQGAAKDGLIQLDPTIYNSATKNYDKRIQAVTEAKNKIELNAKGFSGTVVQIWFYNQKPPQIGYAQGRQIAYQKITRLHDDVKSGKITMEQAGDQIRNDSSLYNIDEAYKINASFSFTDTKDTPATFDEGYNKILASTPPGGVTDVYTAKDEDQSGNIIDALYMFGRIDKKNDTSSYVNYQDWLMQKKKIYEVITY